MALQRHQYTSPKTDTIRPLLDSLSPEELASASSELSSWFSSLLSSKKEKQLPHSIQSKLEETVGSVMGLFSDTLESSVFSDLKNTFLHSILNLFSAILSQYLHRESFKNAEFLLSSEAFLRSLLSFCLDLYLFIQNVVAFTFEDVLELLEVSVFDFWKQVNYFAAYYKPLPAPMLVYFKKLNQKILTETAWKGHSEIFKTVLHAFSTGSSKTTKNELLKHGFTQFFKKLVAFFARRINLVCNAIGLNEEIQETVWTLSKFFLSEHTEYLKDCNAEIIILCGIYAACHLKCEIPLANIYHKYKEVTGIERFSNDINEAFGVNQFYSNVYSILMKKFLKTNINECTRRIEALFPVSPLSDNLPPTSENSPVWMTPRTLQLLNQEDPVSLKSKASRRLVFDDYAKPNKKPKFI